MIALRGQLPHAPKDRAAVLRRLQRWARRDPTTRRYPIVSTSPEEGDHVLLTCREGEAPSGVWEVVADPGVAWEEMIESVDMDAWEEAPGERATILRGDRRSQGAIADIRDRILGIGHKRDRQDDSDDTVTLAITPDPPSSFLSAISGILSENIPWLDVAVVGRIWTDRPEAQGRWYSLAPGGGVPTWGLALAIKDAVRRGLIFDVREGGRGSSGWTIGDPAPALPEGWLDDLGVAA